VGASHKGKAWCKIWANHCGIDFVEEGFIKRLKNMGHPLWVNVQKWFCPPS